MEFRRLHDVAATSCGQWEKSSRDEVMSIIIYEETDCNVVIADSTDNIFNQVNPVRNKIISKLPSRCQRNPQRRQYLPQIRVW